MAEQLKKLMLPTGAQYAIIFYSPALSGEETSSYSTGFIGAGGAYSGGGVSETSHYTADIEVLVWDCSTGRLLFSSGAWSRASPCLFSSAADVAINRADRSFLDKLEIIISRVIVYDTSMHFANKSQ